jgi:hypothetical protein
MLYLDGWYIQVVLQSSGYALRMLAGSVAWTSKVPVRILHAAAPVAIRVAFSCTSAFPLPGCHCDSAGLHLTLPHPGHICLVMQTM